MAAFSNIACTFAVVAVLPLAHAESTRSLRGGSAPVRSLKSSGGCSWWDVVCKARAAAEAEKMQERYEKTGEIGARGEELRDWINKLEEITMPEHDDPRDINDDTDKQGVMEKLREWQRKNAEKLGDSDDENTLENAVIAIENEIESTYNTVKNSLQERQLKLKNRAVEEMDSYLQRRFTPKQIFLIKLGFALAKLFVTNKAFRNLVFALPSIAAEGVHMFVCFLFHSVDTGVITEAWLKNGSCADYH